MFGHPDSAVVHRMINLIQLRGPDGQDVWSDENISLGHTRLAIVDLNGSQQPMHGHEILWQKSGKTPENRKS